MRELKCYQIILLLCRLMSPCWKRKSHKLRKCSFWAVTWCLNILLVKVGEQYPPTSSAPRNVRARTWWRGSGRDCTVWPGHSKQLSSDIVHIVLLYKPQEKCDPTVLRLKWVSWHKLHGIKMVTNPCSLITSCLCYFNAALLV